MSLINIACRLPDVHCVWPAGMTWGPDKAASSAAAPAAPLDGMEGLEQPLIALRFGQTTHLQEVGAGFASDVVPVHAATWSCSVLQAGLCVLGFFAASCG